MVCWRMARVAMAPAVFVVLVVASGCSSSSTQATGIPSGPPVGPVKWTALDSTKAVRAAATLGSCLPDDRANRILQRMYVSRGSDSFEARLWRSAIDCLAAKTNGCGALGECLAIVVEPSADCAASCAGSVSEQCNDGLKYRVDCGRYGMVCDTRDMCVLPRAAGKSCDSTKFVGACDAGAPTYCSYVSKDSSEEARGPVCADFGLVCGPLSSGTSVGCNGAGARCSTGTVNPRSITYVGTGCDGTKLTACVNEGEVSVDCGTFATGFTCQSKVGAARTGWFCGTGADCDPTEPGSKPTCEGNSLVVCNGGKSEKVDCTSLGFTGCNAKYGVCSPSPWP